MNWHNFAKFVLDKHIAIIRPTIDNIFALFHFASLKQQVSPPGREILIDPDVLLSIKSFDSPKDIQINGVWSVYLLSLSSRRLIVNIIIEMYTFTISYQDHMSIACGMEYILKLTCLVAHLSLILQENAASVDAHVRFYHLIALSSKIL